MIFADYSQHIPKITASPVCTAIKNDTALVSSKREERSTSAVIRLDASNLSFSLPAWQPLVFISGTQSSQWRIQEGTLGSDEPPPPLCNRGDEMITWHVFCCFFVQCVSFHLNLDLDNSRQEPEAISATNGCALRKSGEPTVPRHLKVDTVSD